MSCIGSETVPTVPGYHFVDRLARRVLLRRLDSLRDGTVTLQDATAATSLGESSELHASLQVNQPRFFRQAVLGGELAVAESYVRGDWDSDELTNFFRIFVRNAQTTDRLGRGWSGLVNLSHRVSHWWRSNSLRGSRRNIAAHYDLGNGFYRLWLDDTMSYSCGIFPTPDASLREASLEKMDRVCRNLDLKPRDHVLEIGAGWGGFAIYAATNYGCRVTTTTISQEQYHAAQERIREAGLQDRITLLLQDYRDLQGQFDKLVSIEMIEAVGHRYLDQYFRQCANLLQSDGSLFLQAIVMPEQGYSQYLRSVDFIQRFVFPGGCLPSLGSILASVARTTEFRLVHSQDFSPHYAETLRHWRDAFNRQLDAVRTLGYSEELIRLWNYYLCYCEAAFEERAVGVIQIQFDMPGKR